MAINSAEDQPRDSAGKFGAKTGSAPETALKSNVEMVKLADYLDDGRNGFDKPITAATRAKTFAFLDEPTHENWEEARSAIFTARGRDSTLWQLTLANSEFTDRDPGATPSSAQVFDALEYRFGHSERALADGRSVEIPNSIRTTFRGVNDEGDLIAYAGFDHADGREYLIPLTQCCNASGKGGEGGIVCRACYAEVDGRYGGDQDATFTRVV